MARLPSIAAPATTANMRLPLKALAAFEAVARLGSIAKAAAELGVTPSAISHQLKALQDLAGVKLLATARGGALLTAHGERFAGELLPTMAAIRAAYERVTPDRAFVLEIKPLLSLALQAASPHAPPMREGVILRLASRPAGSDIAAADAALRLGACPAPDTTALPMGSLPVTLFSARLLGPKEIAKAPLLVSRDWPDAEDTLRAWVAEPVRVQAFETLSDVVLACEHGEGIALLPIALVRRQIRNGALRPLRIGEGPLSPCPLTLHVRSAPSSLRRAKALAQVLRPLIRDLALDTLS